jgi:ribonucleoside-diphosphate reductase alpha chain
MYNYGLLNSCGDKNIMKDIKLSSNALEIATSRYFKDGENWEGCASRVANTIATSEGQDKGKIIQSFTEMIYNMDFIPAGRILRNSGRSKGSLLNCYHLSIGDSIEEIGQFIKDALILWSEGGGVGANFSALRPKGDIILGKGGHSSGLVSFIEAADSVAGTIESGGSRRAAALAHVDISHPEVINFIDAKIKDGRISRFNISVAIDEEFLLAVEKDDNWTFKFKQKQYNTIKARDLWNKMVHNMIQYAEPGIINWRNFSKNNSYYFAPVSGTNPGGETCLSDREACDLGSLVLPNFITGNVNTNWKKLETTIKLAVRFLDNVIDVNKYALKEIDINVHKSRRTGIGVIGLAEYLFAKQVRYGSERAVVETERLMRFIRDAAYTASVELAIEKGAFPKFDAGQYGQASFIRKLPATLRTDIKKYGTRNCTLMALAPTGTISLLADYSSGIEPLFAKAFERKDRVGNRIYIHPKYQEVIQNSEETPDWFVDSFELQPKDHFEMQVACQKFCDASVSKTINLPKETTEEDLSALLLEYMYDLKGVTVYRDGSREGQILNKMSDEEARKYLNTDGHANNHLQEGDVVCATGSCEI